MKYTKIVEITGGLGNQMFQYAFGKYLSQKYPNDVIKYDLGYYSAKNAIREYELNKAFGLEIQESTPSEIRSIRGYNPQDSSAKRAIFKLLNSPKKVCVITEDLDRSFDEKYISTNNDAYYSGYWQNEKYFDMLRNDILSSFSFEIDDLSEEGRLIVDDIKNTNSVSVHVRLEDYLNEDNFRIYGNICTTKYYENSLAYIKEKFPDCKFFLFSTEIEKALEMLPSEYDYVPVKYDGQNGYLDMYMMTKCKHNIIANSTFSWWGAWLNCCPEKVVVCPNRWFNNHSVNNQLCEDWIKF